LVPGQPRDRLQKVMQRFWNAGGRVIDTSPLYGSSETTVGDFASALGIGDRTFIANKIWSTGEYLADESHARRSLEQSMQRLWRERIDLMQCHSLVNVDVVLPLLRAWKKEGRIRLLGLTHHDSAYMDVLTALVEREPLDFVQVNYSIFSRRAEQRLLPLAQERGIAVLVNMPFEKARLFKIVEREPLPTFAQEFGARTWAQFFLKWVISHPAVTCVLPATSNPAHVEDNMGALQGPLPDARMRERMVRHMEALPEFGRIAQMPWYPGKQYNGLIARAQGALRARQ
jgi:diketogulonate reductase-like aldo/keto reductase